MCDFSAKNKLMERRAAAGDPELSPEAAYQIIQAIDEERWKHAEETGCDCWLRAIQEAA